MTAICPRCGTVCLVGMQATRFTCKVCRLRFCHECRHWQVDRKQSYCARCGAAFNIPPPVMPPRVLSLVIYAPIGMAILLTAFVRLQLWQVVLAALLPPVIYTTTYLAVFYRRTGLAQATWREMLLLIRRTLTLAAVVYLALKINDPTTPIIGAVILAALVLIGLLARYRDAQVIRELQANRPAWETFLSRSDWDALLMRFPDARRQTKEATR